jgi:hypothetical protein
VATIAVYNKKLIAIVLRVFLIILTRLNTSSRRVYCLKYRSQAIPVMDLILVVVELLKRDINGLVKIVREALKPIEL